MFVLRLRMFLLLAVMFAILYAFATMIGVSMGIDNFYFYLGLSLVFIFIQYMIGPKIIEWSMRVRYCDRAQYPKLHQMIEELAMRAGIPKPKIGIASIGIPNAFAFGRGLSDGRICVTEGITRLLN
ncbi:MAG TPA: M48 family metalloprotease, partial [Candidatus Omnitrophota bacterium]|nr:M48 family metalloprotease [Candidatus Omnitrophota bacterium]